jgi:hypothetical protein
MIAPLQVNTPMPGFGPEDAIIPTMAGRKPGEGLFQLRYSVIVPALIGAACGAIYSAIIVVMYTAFEDKLEPQFMAALTEFSTHHIGFTAFFLAFFLNVSFSVYAQERQIFRSIQGNYNNLFWAMSMYLPQDDPEVLIIRYYLYAATWAAYGSAVPDLAEDAERRIRQLITDDTHYNHCCKLGGGKPFGGQAAGHMLLITTQKIFAVMENARSRSKEFSVTEEVLQLRRSEIFESMKNIRGLGGSIGDNLTDGFSVPAAYCQVIIAIIACYLLALPLGLVQEYGWWTVVWTASDFLQYSGAMFLSFGLLSPYSGNVRINLHAGLSETESSWKRWVPIPTNTEKAVGCGLSGSQKEE